MRFTSLELFGYRRFLLNNIEYLKISPTEKVQLILGTNGSGKSSLLRELTPLPATASDYRKDGYKILKLTHLKHQYVLSSYFSPTQKHNFIKDDVELNPGGTLTVQKELVKKEFGITLEIHEMMLGIKLFHSMTPSERRQWFTRLSDTNYNYAIGIFQKLKEKQRDITGAIKMNQSRAVAEANKLLTPEQEVQLQAEVKELQTVVTELLSLRPSKTIMSGEVKSTLRENDRLLKEQANLIKKLRKQFLNLEGYVSVDDIRQMIQSRQIEIGRIEAQIEHTAKELDQQQKTADALSKSNVSSVKDLDRRLATNELKLSAYTKQLRTEIVFPESAAADQALSTIRDTLTDVFAQLAPNKNKEYSRERFAFLTEQIKHQSARLKQIESQQLQFLAEKKEQLHLRTHGLTECPECKHKWVRGYEPTIVARLERDLARLGDEYTSIEKQITVAQESLEQIRQYIAVYKTYTDIVKTWHVLKPLWNYYLESEALFDNPRNCTFILDRVAGDIQIQVQLALLNKEREELTQLKKLTQSDSEGSLEQLNLRITALNDQLFDQNALLRQYKRDVRNGKTYRDVAEEIQRTEQTLERLVSERMEQGELLIESLRKDAINTLIQTVQLSLSKKERTLSQVTVQKALVDSIQKQLADLDAENEVLKIMLKELSPTDGLIAKGLMGFINTMVRQMNTFIKKVWLYPLEIMACLPDEQNEIDLDYKFSVKVNDTHVISDVSKTSSAMTEVINLAFRVVSMKYLSLTTAPLMLDEFSSSFDTAHRTAAFKLINDILTYSEFSQIYLVSHYTECYGSLKNAQVTVMCDSNITLPQETIFNQHVIMR